MFVTFLFCVARILDLYFRAHPARFVDVGRSILQLCPSKCLLLVVCECNLECLCVFWGSITGDFRSCLSRSVIIVCSTFVTLIGNYKWTVKGVYRSLFSRSVCCRINAAFTRRA